MNLPEQAKLKRFTEKPKNAAHVLRARRQFEKIYHHDHAEYFTSPGRTEIIGNHTDHNGGKVIGSINPTRSVPHARTTLTLSASPVKATMRSL